MKVYTRKGPYKSLSATIKLHYNRVAKAAQTTNEMTSMKTWRGQSAGEYSFGVVPAGAKVPQRTTLSVFEGKPLVIHFYSDG